MTITLRPETSPGDPVSDEPFLRRLILDTIAGELSASAWPEPMRSHLLGVQYTARRHSSRESFPDAASHVIEMDGVNAGWVLVNTMPHEVRLVEIMVLPELRGRGIGVAVLSQLISGAAAAGKPVRLNVNVTNHAAIRFYERLGFCKIEQDELQYLMEKS
jgi:ribosomal protein S18 acetylase RimI-like enzyme